MALVCVMEEIPNSKFKPLQELGRNLGVTDLINLRKAKNATHDSPKTFNQVR